MRMTIDDIQRVVEEFVKRLQLPESKYGFAINSGNDAVELIIFIGDDAVCSLGIGNGTLRVIYNDEYKSDNYGSYKFITPIGLVYYLCVFFYNSVVSVSTMDFNDLLSVIFLNEIYDWRTLAQGICENVGMDFERRDDLVFVNGVQLSYNGFLNKIKIDSQEIKLDDSNYTTVVDAIFKSVEYVANVMGVADDLFLEESLEGEEENNLLEGGEEEGGAPSGGAPSLDMDIDVNEGGGESNVEEAPEPVPAMENEDMSEPQGPVVTLEDVT